MKEIKVFHVDDHEIMRDGVKILLSGDPSIKIVGEACSSEQMLNRIQSIEVDVIILDIFLNDDEHPMEVEGFKICQLVNEAFPTIRILAHTNYDDADKVARIIRLGALGFVSKKCGFEELIYAVKEVFARRVYICRNTADKLKNLDNFLTGVECNLRGKEELFSVREREVLNLLAQGRSSREISTMLQITERTVETHRKNMIDKARMKNTVELVAYAASLKLIHK
jgi:DNA-binding NarL/FixJ family response regulator